MHNFRIISDLDQCQDIWKRVVPQETIWDIWEFRACFQECFKRPPCFIVGENSQGLTDLLPLSWIDESQSYGIFPGETWRGMTWLEQNRVPASQKTLLDMLSICPGPYYLRYLLPSSESMQQNQQLPVDEIGYLFLPPKYDYNIDNYFKEFSRKSEKGIKRAVDSLHCRASYRYDDIADFEHLVQLNIDNFKEYSYFHDQRFLGGFRAMMHYLNEKGWLRLTTVIIDGDVAAVDIGCIYRGHYTLLGGGTNRDYLGIAKLINLLHIQRGCRERFDVVDFLCGDFSWKLHFHLTPRPLYLLSNCSLENPHSQTHELGGAEHVK